MYNRRSLMWTRFAQFVSGLTMVVVPAVASSGCGGSDATTTSGSKNVEIFSWWVSGSETKALQTVLDIYEDEHPDVTLTNAAVLEASNAKATLKKRMEQGLPPDVFQANGGLDMLSWVKFNGKDDTQSKLEPIETLGDVPGWAAAVPAALKNDLSYNGHLYGAALNVHRENCLFYNKKIFDDNNLTPPKTLAEFYAVADALKAKGITPLALGSNGAWTISLLWWENVFPLVAGPTYYLDFFHGKKSAFDPEVKAALEETAKVLGYVNADAEQLTWDQAISLVADGKAAMNFMGDWAKGELTSLGKKADVDFGEMNWGDKTFVYTMDAFVLPKGAPDRQNAIDLLSVMSSIEGQAAFNPLKGSIPARTDVPGTNFDSISQRGMLDFKTDTLLASHFIFVGSDFGDPTDKQIGLFAKDKNVDNMIAVIDNYYDLIPKK